MNIFISSATVTPSANRVQCFVSVNFYLSDFDLQVWTKHSGQPAYRKEAKLYLPGKTLEEIEQHEDWHQELIYLQDRKREVETKHE